MIRLSIEISNEPVAGAIRRCIARRGMKISAVAEKSGFSDKQFSSILCGRKQIKACDIPRIADALEVTPNELFEKADQ